MRRKIHKTDAVFRKAYRTFEETPSPEVWKKLSARLDEMRPERTSPRPSKGRYLLLFGLFLPSLILQNPVVDREWVRFMTGKYDSIHAAPAANEETRIMQLSPVFIRPADADPVSAISVQYTSPVTFNPSSLPHRDPVAFLLSSANKPSLPLPAKLPVQPETIQPSLQGSRLTVQKLTPFFTTHWELTAFTSVDNAGYRIDSDLPPQLQQDKHSILERERNELSFSAGLLATWRFHQRLGLQSGLFYSLTSIHIDPQTLLASQSPDGSIIYRYNTSAGYANIRNKLAPMPAIGDSLATTEAKLDLHSLNVPVLLQYQVGKGKLKFTPAAGIAVSFSTKALLKTEMSDNRNNEREFSEKLQGTNMIYWSVMASGAVTYETGKRWKVHVTPMFRYAISPITKNNVVESFPYSAGVAAGVTCRF